MRNPENNKFTEMMQTSANTASAKFEFGAVLDSKGAEVRKSSRFWKKCSTAKWVHTLKNRFRYSRGGARQKFAKQLQNVATFVDSWDSAGAERTRHFRKAPENTVAPAISGRHWRTPSQAQPAGKFFGKNTIRNFWPGKTTKLNRMRILNRRDRTIEINRLHSKWAPRRRRFGGKGPAASWSPRSSRPPRRTWVRTPVNNFE